MKLHISSLYSVYIQSIFSVVVFAIPLRRSLWAFAFQIFEAPALSILPLIIILAVYGSRIKLPFNIPGGFAALMVGVALAWSFRAAGKDYFDPVGVFLIRLYCLSMTSFTGGWVVCMRVMCICIYSSVRREV